MAKRILITGATDGIGRETARMLAPEGHELLLHGRNAGKLASLEKELGAANVSTFVADLSRLDAAEALAASVRDRFDSLDVLINNAGVYSTPEPRTADGLDVRFAVNTIVPYQLTQALLPLMGPSGRIINVSSAAQAPVDLAALAGNKTLGDGGAYAQSKLAITMWSRHLALALGDGGPSVISVNPGSLLGSKMVKEAFGMDGGDLGIGAGILCRLALDEAFANASGEYYDNDAGRIGPPHADALDAAKAAAVVDAMESIIAAR